MDTEDDKKSTFSPASAIPDVIPVWLEEVQVGKRWRDAGYGVRVHKQTQQSKQEVRQDLTHEDIEVRHVPMDQVVSLDAAPMVRQEGDTLIIPITEEILVVQKRLRIKEEVHITKIRHTTVHSETVPLTSQTVCIERFDDASPASAGTDSPPNSQQTGSS